jgi:hypothetical protein
MTNKGIKTRLIAVFFAVVFALLCLNSCDGAKNLTERDGVVKTPSAAPDGGNNGNNGAAPADEPDEPADEPDAPPVPITGGGTVSDPYLIKNPSDINYLKTYGDAVFLLKNDVDFSGIYLTPIGDFDAPFEGTFLNPDNFTLSNLTVSAGALTNVGFFGVLANGAIVDGLRINNISFIVSDGDNSLNLGAVCGVSYGIIKNCHISGVEIDISNYLSNVGGLVGFLINGEICDSFVSGEIASGGTFNNVGLIVGQSSGGEIENVVSSSCNIDAVNMSTAGAIGKSEYSLIKSIEVNGIIKAFKTGGIVGESRRDTISDCSVIAELYGAVVGGMAGEVLDEIAISNSTFSGKLVYLAEIEVFRVYIGGVTAIITEADAALISLDFVSIDAEITCITAYSSTISDIYPDSPLYDNVDINIRVVT